MSDEDWLAVNRANWDESVAAHLSHPSYDLEPLRAGRGRLYPIEAGELGDVSGLRLLHLQCHFGRDSLTLAQQGAHVVGVDFSPEAVTTASALAAELGLSDRARFVCADVHDTLRALADEASFDVVFTTWGVLMWLPDLTRWAEIVAGMLKPGGWLYMAEAHPAAMVLGDSGVSGRRLPEAMTPYFAREAMTLDSPGGYANDRPLDNARTYEWLHGLGDIVSALSGAGLRIDWLHEHDAVAWPLFNGLVEGDDGLSRWPETAWLPLSFSLKASKTRQPER